MIKSAWPCFAPDEIEAAAAVLRSGKVNYWTGEEGRNFEREFGKECGARFSVALANGTIALELALISLGIGPGDDVIVTPRSFIASASCVAIIKARPVFAEIDPVSQNITAETICTALTPRTKAVICVHLAGWPCDMDPIRELARTCGFAVIEDCAQAHGARYKGRPVGTLGDVATFSFCQDKIMTTAGEGGALVTNDEALFEQAWSYKDHGKSRLYTERQKPSAAYRWLHERFGTNWRITEIQAAVGRIQLRKLEAWVEVRRRNALIMDEMLAGVEALRLAIPEPDYRHAYYRYYVFVRPERFRRHWDRRKLIEAIRARGVPCFVGVCPEIYREQAFVQAGLQPARPLPIARELGDTSVALLVDPTLSEDDTRITAGVVREAVLEATA